MMPVLLLAVSCRLPVSHNEHVEIEVTNDFLALTGVDWRAEVVPRDEAT